MVRFWMFNLINYPFAMTMEMKRTKIVQKSNNYEQHSMQNTWSNLMITLCGHRSHVVLYSLLYPLNTGWWKQQGKIEDRKEKERERKEHTYTQTFSFSFRFMISFYTYIHTINTVWLLDYCVYSLCARCQLTGILIVNRLSSVVSLALDGIHIAFTV